MRVSKARLLLFAFGDFAFNLYWQSVMMFLLFYYTDSIDVQIGIASASYLIASVWDGLANFGAGMLLEHRQSRIRYGTLISIGGVPLGLSFILMYVPPLAQGAVGLASAAARPARRARQPRQEPRFRHAQRRDDGGDRCDHCARQIRVLLL